MYINVCGGTAQRIGRKREAPLDRRCGAHSTRAQDGYPERCVAVKLLQPIIGPLIYHMGVVGGLKQRRECYATTKEGSGGVAANDVFTPVASAQNGEIQYCNLQT